MVEFKNSDEQMENERLVLESSQESDLEHEQAILAAAAALDRENAPESVECTE